MSLNAINWFEIPVSNMQRAKQFYQAVSGADFRDEVIHSSTLAIFSYEKPGVGGCLVHAQNDAYQPGNHGALVYLPIKDSISQALQRVTAAGGKVVTDATQLPGDMGCYAHITDTEGNRVGLHAMN